MINGTKLVVGQELDLESADWRQIHAAVSKIQELRGLNRMLHIQYFFERGTQPKRLREVKQATKIALADIDIYISCIDGHYRGDDTKWDNGAQVTQTVEKTTAQRDETKSPRPD